MAKELQPLKDLVAQMREDNKRLKTSRAGLGCLGYLGGIANGAATNEPAPIGNSTAAVPIIERRVFIPREHKCPIFSGKSDQQLNEWIEEAQASMRVQHLEGIDKAAFLYEHLEAEAREEITL